MRHTRRRNPIAPLLLTARGPRRRRKPVRSRRNPYYSRNPYYLPNPGGGALLLLGGAAFLFLTTAGQSLLSQFGLSTGGVTVPAGAVNLGNGTYRLATGQVVSASSLVGIPAGLPAGTVRLANGQYQEPDGSVVGTPTVGYAAVTGSSIVPVLQTATQAVSALSPLISFFTKLFGSTQGGGGGGGATGSPGAGGGMGVAAPAITLAPGAQQATMLDGNVATAQVDSGGNVVGFYGPGPNATTIQYDASGAALPVQVAAGTLTLSDGSVLAIGGMADPSSTAPTGAWPGLDLSLSDWWSGLWSGAPVPSGVAGATDIGVVTPIDLSSSAPIDLSTFQAGLDTSGFSFADVAPVFDPGAVAAGFGALSPTRRVGWTPVPMRHG